MAPYRTNRVLAALPEPLYRSLVWLDVRVAMLFSIGLPLVLLIWAGLRREGALVRLGCRVDRMVEVERQRLVVARVMTAVVAHGAPLVRYGRAYHRLADGA